MDSNLSNEAKNLGVPSAESQATSELNAAPSLQPKWCGIDDGLNEKRFDGRIFDRSDGCLIFEVPPEYRELIVKAVNSYHINNAVMNEAADKILELQEENRRLKEHVKDLDHDLQASVNEANWQNRQGDEYGGY